MQFNQDKKNKLETLISQSPFNITPNHTITYSLNRFMNAFRDFNNSVLEANKNDWESLAMATPEFQRSNDMWTRQMQTKFVENVVCGFRSTIQLYSISERDNYDNCKVMDGLQRSTALCSWLQGDFPIFGDLHYPEVKSPLFSTSIVVTIQIFNFQSELQAVDYYIAINENITHSPEDIKRAKAYRQMLIEKMG